MKKSLIILLISLIALLCSCSNTQNKNKLEDLKKQIAELDVWSDETIRLGKYDGKEIEWTIIEKDDDNKKALLLSQTKLRELDYTDKGYEPVTWETSYLRKWLNSDFLNNSFNNEEKSIILETLVKTGDNEGDTFGTKWHTKGGNDTKDKIYIMSIDEYNKYYKIGGQKIDMSDYKDHPYYLRSPGEGQEFVAGVNPYYEVLEAGFIAQGAGFDVKPMMWVSFGSNNNVNNVKENEGQVKSNKQKTYFIKNIHDAKLVTDYPDGTLTEEMDVIRCGYGTGIGFEWLLLERNDTEATLMLEDCKNYLDFIDSRTKSINWENSQIREYLNESFYNRMFTSEEKEIIKEKEIETNCYMTLGRNTKNFSGEIETIYTKDKVYILSLEECEKYFNNDKTKLKEYDDILDKSEPWWLRNTTSEVAVGVNDLGKIGISSGESAVYEEAGLRAVITIDISNVK